MSSLMHRWGNAGAGVLGACSPEGLTLLGGPVGRHGPLPHHAAALAALAHHGHGRLALVVLAPALRRAVVGCGRLLVHHGDCLTETPESPGKRRPAPDLPPPCHLDPKACLPAQGQGPGLGAGLHVPLGRRTGLPRQHTMAPQLSANPSPSSPDLPCPWAGPESHCPLSTPTDPPVGLSHSSCSEVRGSSRETGRSHRFKVSSNHVGEERGVCPDTFCWSQYFQVTF